MGAHIPIFETLQLEDSSVGDLLKVFFSLENTNITAALKNHSQNLTTQLLGTSVEGGENGVIPVFFLNIFGHEKNQASLCV